MKSNFTILGSGSSIGVPRIDGNWGNCNPNEKKNIRTRCSAIIEKGPLSILIDTSPDLKHQLLKNKIKNITHVIYTHKHADQTHGINELRTFFWKNKKRINVYSNLETINYLKKTFQKNYNDVKNKYILFLAEDNYGKYVLDELSLACYWTKRYEEGKKYLEQIINDPYFQKHKPRLLENMQHFNLKLNKNN